VMVIAAAGGDPRKVTEFAAASDEVQPEPAVAWMGDGKSLVVAGASEDQPSAVSVVDVETGTVRRITNPAKDTVGDSGPSVSPDGATIAFMRSTANVQTLRRERDRDDAPEGSGRRKMRGRNIFNDEGGDVYLCDRTGGSLRRLTFDDHKVRGIAWMPDGRDLVYSSDRGTGWRLWRLPVYGGTPRDLLIAGHQAQYPAVSRDGRLLFTERAAASAVWRADLAAPGTSVNDLVEKPLIRSDSREIEPAISPDGKRIANVSELNFDQQIWVGDSDGLTPRYQLTKIPGMRLRRLRWSPNSTQLLYETRSQRGIETYKIEVKQNAKPVRVLEDGGASWSHDGKSIYYESNGRIWKAGVDGGEARSITESRNGASGPEESVDGKYVYYRNWRSIWRVPPDGGKEEEIITPENLVWSAIQPVKEGVYYLEWTRAQRSFVLTFYDFATQKSTSVLMLKNIDLAGDGFEVSPDGKHLLYPKTDQNETNLALVANFR
jgi:Tol biopolymer transport system component